MPILIATRDVVEYLRDGRLLWTGALILALLATALAVGWQRQTEARAERVAAAKLDYDDWLQQPERHPHDAAHQGMHVFKPEPALSIVEPGLIPYTGSTLWLQAHRQSEVKFRPANDATGLQRFGTLSAAWILQMLVPLLVIVLGFNALAGERERGTLRQVLSLGVSPRQLLWGKALAIAMSVALVLLPAVVLAVISVLAAVEDGSRLDAALRLGWMGLAYALYLGIFICLVLAVSARAGSSRTALIGLLALWVAMSVVAPRLVADLSRSVYPSASRSEFNKKLDAELNVEYQRAWNEQVGEGTAFGTDVPLSQWGIGLKVHDHAGYAVMDRHFNALWESYSNQQAMQEWIGFLVPIITVRAFSMGITGTDFSQHRAFSTAAEHHRRLMQDIISQDLVEHADGHGESHFEYLAERSLWATVPPFAYEAPKAMEAARQNFRSLLILAAGLVLAVSLMLAATPRRVVA
ncbi:MAG: ABC transporter permease subunit [Burkholderiales bacterium]|nr:ABC transporter permease subunit [Burkholderiales bacterium]